MLMLEVTVQLMVVTGILDIFSSIFLEGRAFYFMAVVLNFSETLNPNEKLHSSQTPQMKTYPAKIGIKLHLKQN